MTLFNFYKAACIITFSIGFFFPQGSNAQFIEGRIHDQETDEPIAYATLGVKNKPVGTTSSPEGIFKLYLDHQEVTGIDTIIISCIGYEDLRKSILDFKENHRSFSLTPLKNELSAVYITSKKGKTKDYGNKGGRISKYPSIMKALQKESDEKGREQAMVIKIDPNVYLKELNIHLNQSKFKKLVMRMNIYEVVNKMPTQPLLHQNVIFTILGDQNRKMPETHLIPLEEYGINLRGHKEIALGIEVLEYEALEGDTLKTAFFVPSNPSLTKESFFRMKSQSEWNQVKNSNLVLSLNAIVLDAQE